MADFLHDLRVGQGMRLTVIGVAIGLAAALALTRLMRALLFDVSPTDLTTFHRHRAVTNSGFAARLLHASAASDEGGSDGGAPL